MSGHLNEDEAREYWGMFERSAQALHLIHYNMDAVRMRAIGVELKARSEALEALIAAAEEYIGPTPLEMLALRDAGDELIGISAEPAWVRFLEALRDAKAALDG